MKYKIDNQDIFSEKAIIIKSEEQDFKMNLLYTVEFKDRTYALMYADNDEENIIAMEYNEDKQELYETSNDDEELYSYLEEILQAIDEENPLD